MADQPLDDQPSSRMLGAGRTEAVHLPPSAAPRNHGRTVAAWTTTLIVVVGAVVAGLGVALAEPWLAWVGGGVVLAGLIVAFTGLNDVSKYEDFLLIIAYWIGPWLGVVLVDRLLRRGTDIQELIGDRKYLNWAGPIAMAVGMVLSIWLFANQVKYHGVLVKSHPSLGDLTFEVGFAVSAIVYYALFTATKPAKGPALVK